MRPSEALAKNIDAVRAIIARYPVANPRVCGSVARGDDHEGSDVDLLVDSTDRTSLYDIAGLKLDLADLLGSPVDVTTPGSLRPKIRENVLRDARAL